MGRDSLNLEAFVYIQLMMTKLAQLGYQILNQMKLDDEAGLLRDALLMEQKLSRMLIELKGESLSCRRKELKLISLQMMFRSQEYQNFLDDHFQQREQLNLLIKKWEIMNTGTSEYEREVLHCQNQDLRNKLIRLNYQIDGEEGKSEELAFFKQNLQKELQLLEGYFSLGKFQMEKERALQQKNYSKEQAKECSITVSSQFRRKRLERVKIENILDRIIKEEISQVQRLQLEEVLAIEQKEEKKRELEQILETELKQAQQCLRRQIQLQDAYYKDKALEIEKLLDSIASSQLQSNQAAQISQQLLQLRSCQQRLFSTLLAD